MYLFLLSLCKAGTVDSKIEIFIKIKLEIVLYFTLEWVDIT